MQSIEAFLFIEGPVRIFPVFPQTIPQRCGNGAISTSTPLSDVMRRSRSPNRTISNASRKKCSNGGDRLPR